MMKTQATKLQPSKPVYGSSVSFSSYIESGDSTPANSTLGTQETIGIATPPFITNPSAAPTSVVSSASATRKMPNATESTNGTSNCNVMRTPEGNTSFDIDIRQINLEEGVAIISTGDDGPIHSVIITRDIGMCWGRGKGLLWASAGTNFIGIIR